VPGPLWPGGPGELPAVVELAGRRYTVPAVPTLRLAWAITRYIPIIPELLEQDARAEVHRRFRHVTDPLDRSDTDEATVALVAELAGVAPGVNGWRAAVRLCASLLGDWAYAAGALMSAGVDPASAPLWRVCAGMYWQFIESPGADPEQVKASRTALFSPLPREPTWMRPVKPPPALHPAQARAGAAALMERASGARLDLAALCRTCGRMGSHTADCPNGADA
jgi:hypothetical protein